MSITDGGASPGPGDAALRRTPRQQRGRERVERLLEAASGLIAEKGSDALRMSEVAAGAGVSIGSLYQYFPDKAAILRTLAERYLAEDRACIAEALEAVAEGAALPGAFAELLDVYYRVCLAEPVRREVWSGTQADPQLRALMLAENRHNAGLLADVLARCGAPQERAALESAALLLWALAEEAVRLALSSGGAEGDRLIEDFKAIAEAELRRRLAGAGSHAGGT